MYEDKYKTSTYSLYACTTFLGVSIGGFSDNNQILNKHNIQSSG